MTTPTVILIDDKLYGYGETLDAAWGSAARQIQGAGRWIGAMRAKMRAVSVSEDQASEVAEMLCADVLAWD